MHVLYTGANIHCTLCIYIYTVIYIRGHLLEFGLGKNSTFKEHLRTSEGPGIVPFRWVTQCGSRRFC